MTSLVLRGGEVVTCNPAGEVAEAIVLADGRIAFVGTEEQALAMAGSSARIVELDGATVLPGLIDTHPHLLHFGALAEACVDLSDAVDHADISSRIAARAATTPPGEWVMGTPVGEAHYFFRRSYRDLAEGVLPDRHVLDQAAPDHPVFLQAWAPVTPNVMAFNSRALELVGIDSSTPDRVSNVWIEKDEHGQPTGRLSGSVTNYYSNDPFMNELLNKIPILNVDAIIPGTVRAMRDYNALGVTTAYEGHAMDFPMVEAYRHLHQTGQLSMRVMCCPEAIPYGASWTVPISEDELVDRLHAAKGMVSRDDEMFRIDGITIGGGGPCWPGLLRMRNAYRDPYGNLTNGVEFVSKQKAQIAVNFCHENGLRLNMITAGDAEHDQFLDQLEALGVQPVATEGRNWIWQHLYILEEEHARRMGKLGLDATTSVSFAWGKGDMLRDRIGEHVLADLVPLKRLLNHNIHVSCGTDWGPKNVFEHIALAVEPRLGQSGQSNAGPAQVVSRQEALAMWTSEAAHVLRWEGVGSLQAGHHADLIIVDRNPLTTPIADLPATQVHATLLGGVAVHGQAFWEARLSG